MSSRVLLEVCVGSVDDALAAVAGGADRLELNCAVSLGGLTPSLGLFAEVRRRVSVPIIAMLRPRSGGFAYSATDFDVMCQDAGSLISAGADGVAFGILTADGDVDAGRCRQLLDVCSDRTAVFHRAFDVTRDPFAALECLIELGFRRVMTSGQAESAAAGADTIAGLVRRSAGRIEILPAGGVNQQMVGELLARTGCDQVHAGLRTIGHDSSVAARPSVRFGRTSPLSEGEFDRTDLSAVAALRAALGR
jgi:copper homeostasis protein